MRVFLEKLPNGRYQGACFPFRAGFGSGIVPMRFGTDGSLRDVTRRAADLAQFPGTDRCVGRPVGFEGAGSRRDPRDFRAGGRSVERIIDRICGSGPPRFE